MSRFTLPDFQSNQVLVLNPGHKANSRLASIWLGASQGLLNAPRIGFERAHHALLTMLKCLWVLLCSVAVFIATAAITIAMTLMLPLAFVVGALALGFAGRLVDARTDEASKLPEGATRSA